MGTFRSVVAITALIGAAVVTVPAVADGTRGPSYSDRAYNPSIWQGLYGGVHLGWAGRTTTMVSLAAARSTTTGKSQQLVYSVEADISAADIGVSDTIYASASIEWLSTIRGRIGVLAQPRVLLYGAASLSILNADTHDTETGFVYGVGVEGKVAKNVRPA